jgi:DNA polymerase-3 subunit alpha
VIKITNRVNTYSNIHSHDFFSVLDGHSSPQEVLQRCSDLGLKATAVTNHGNEFAFYYYAKLKKDFPNVKVLYGVEFYEAFNYLEKDNENKYFHLIALAKNNKGIQAIHQLITKSNFNGFYYKPRIDLEQLKPFAEDLIITNACMGGKLGKFINDYDKVLEYTREYQEIFGDNFYLELQCHSSESQILFNKTMLKVSKDTSIPYIITNDNHYTDKSKQNAHAYFVNINRDNADIENLTEIYDDCYIHDIDEMYFIIKKSGLTDEEITIGLENTNKIADLCNGEIEFGNPELPHIEVPNDFKSEEEWFQYLIMKGWNKYIVPNIKDGLVYNEYSEPVSVKTYQDRIIEEFETMRNMGFIGYHLIIQDFINWAKDNKIPVGDGRGSAVGSLINYLIGITNIDPIPNGLFFSRYLNKDRVSNPDIDSDFMSSKRIEVFNYIKEKYGEDRVAQIINFTYISPKVAVKDAGRCLGKTVKEMDALSEFMTQDTIQESIENSKQSQKLRDLLMLHQDVIDLAKNFENRPRSLSINACGTVISSKPIYNYCGMLKGDEGEQLLQVDKIIAEELGMVKCDLLGLKTLDIIEETLQKIGSSFYKYKFDIHDKETYEYMSSGLTYGIFQLESNNMTKFFKKLKPKTLEDVCAGISLYRPGAMQYIDNYLIWKEDNSKIVYLSNNQRNALDATHGCMVYQEQVQQILADLAGFSFAQADLVRRGMAKKKKEYVLGQRSNFIYGLAESEINGEIKEFTHEYAKQNLKDYKVIINGCIHDGISEESASKIFDEMEKFAEYAFNKSHGFAYAKGGTYNTAYLKCHYPLEFMTTLLSHTSDNTKICQYLIQCRDMGLKLLTPDINNSDLGFKIFNDSILYGIGSLNNVGEPTVKQIVKNRPYKSFQDFFSKNIEQIQEGEIKIDKSALISLINGGCFDNIPANNEDTDLPTREMLLGKIFFYNTSLITKVSTTNIPELFDNNLIESDKFEKEKEVYYLHKELLSKKNILDLINDDITVNKFKKHYTSESYEINDNKLILTKKYKNEYEKNLKLLKEDLKDNSEKYATLINKRRVVKAYLEYKGNQDTADLEFESTSFYFQPSWLTTSVEKYGVDEFNEIPDLNMDEVGYYSKKKLYTIVGTLTGKVKKHKEIILLTNSGIVIAKLGDILYNNVASDLKRGNKIALNGYTGNSFFRAEYYENGKSNKLKALKVIE